QITRTSTVDDALARVRALVDKNIPVHVIYVVDDDEHLVGGVDLARLAIQPRERKVSEIIEPLVAKVTPDVDQEQVAAIFKKYSSDSLPVVDREGRLLGRIPHDDIVHVLVEQSEEDARTLA